MNFKLIENGLKPREKAIKYGISTLTDIEIIALILRTGTKKKNVLMLSQELTFYLYQLSQFNELSLKTLLDIQGIGVSKALEILGCLELAKRLHILNHNKEAIKVSWPIDVFKLMKDHYSNVTQEHFYLLLLNNQNKLIHQTLIYKGTSDRIEIDVKDILYHALIQKSTKVICVHNHPSGDSEASFADIRTTKEMKQKLFFFNIILLDHIIIGHNNYYSIHLKQKYYFSEKNPIY